MNPVIDLTKLSYERLQKYRKSLTNKCNRYATCWCGISGCEFHKEELKDNHLYLELKQELERVLTECQRRNKLTIAKQKKDKWAHVPTHKELSR